MTLRTTSPRSKSVRPRSLGEAKRSIQGRANGQLSRRFTAEALPLVGGLHRYSRPSDVPPWGTYERDKRLRQLWTLHGNEPIQGATAAIVQKVQSTGWHLEGPRNVAARVHSMLHNADFGNGWEPFLSKVIADYLLQDNGCFVEILGEGRPDQMLTGPALGIAHLDSAKCTRTGDLEYPVTYRDELGKLHKLHWSRVWLASDMPSPEERKLGVGFCSLSRCVSSAQTLINWSEMRNEMIDDFPAAGVLAMSGINRESFENQMKAYEADRARKEQEVYRGLVTLFQPNPTYQMKMELLNFRQLWEGFEERSLYDTIIDLVAMAFGIDRQEIAPLATSALGSGAQSTVLNQKSRGKGVGNLLSLLERFVNRIVPSSVVFRFDFSDDEQDMMQAQIRQMKATTIVTLYTAAGKPSNIQFGGVQAAEPSYTTNPQRGQVGDGKNPPVGAEKAFGTDEGQPGAKDQRPDRAVQGTYTADVSSSGLLDRDEARYLLAKEGIIPRELLSESEKLNPAWEQFDEITMKAAERRYGRWVVLHKDGSRADVTDYYQERKRKAIGIQWREALPA